MDRRRVARSLSLVGLLALCGVLGVNAASLREGFAYLGQALAYDPAAVCPIDPTGPYGVCLPLAEGTNAQRHDLIVARLRETGLDPTPVSVPEHDLPSLFVPLAPSGPYVVFDAHYDKFRETPTYQGAADNTAAVAVLLAAAADLATMSPAPPVALLFSSGEEHGLLGARAFSAWAETEGVELWGAVVFDTLGRGRLTARPTGWSGLRFWLPGMGWQVYDGRSVGEAGALVPPDAALLGDLRAAADDDLMVMRRMAAYTNAQAFHEAAIPTVAITCSDIYYLDQVWERDADRVELLDEGNLAMGRRLVVGYANGLAAPSGASP